MGAFIPEEYLAIERTAEFRSEYHHGEMFAMAGGAEAHTMLVDNLMVQLAQNSAAARAVPIRITCGSSSVPSGRTSIAT